MPNTASRSGVRSFVLLVTALLTVACATMGMTTAHATPKTDTVHNACLPVTVNHVRRIVCTHSAEVSHQTISRSCHLIEIGESHFCFGAPPTSAAQSVHQSVDVPMIVSAVKKAATKPKTAPSPTPTASAPAPAPTPASAPATSGPHATGMIGPCAGQSLVWPSNIGNWTVPSGCWGKIFYPSQSQYPYVHSSWGWCNWWLNAMHPNQQDITWSLHYSRGMQPVAGAGVWFAPGVEGASPEGHWAEVAAVGPNGWILVTEMNFTWRGGGFGKVDYRFVKVQPGVQFVYA